MSHLQSSPHFMHSFSSPFLSALFAGIVACSGPPAETPPPSVPVAAGEVWVLRDTIVPTFAELSGVTEPYERATLATKLLGTVQRVLVREGDRVAEGALLAEIDAEELVAKQSQLQAQIAAASASLAEAKRNAERFRALYADSAAPRAMLDAAEAGLARAEAQASATQGQQRELLAVARYARITAPFSGVIVRRHLDPGALALPGAPVLEIQRMDLLRVRVDVTPRNDVLRKGTSVAIVVEGTDASAIVESTVPSMVPGLSSVQLLLQNRGGRFPVGASTTVRIPLETRSVVLVPAAALIRQGNLTGVTVIQGGNSRVRWVRTGAQYGDMLELVSGVRAGDSVRVSPPR